MNTHSRYLLDFFDFFIRLLSALLIRRFLVGLLLVGLLLCLARGPRGEPLDSSGFFPLFSELLLASLPRALARRLVLLVEIFFLRSRPS